MKSNIKIAGFLMAILVTLGSCKKSFLDLKPTDSLAFDQAITDEQTMQAALFGAYSGMRGTDFMGRSVPLVGDLLADNVYVSTANSGRYIPQYNYQMTNADGTANGFWNTAYNVILRCNQIINSEGNVSGSKVSQYVGEAYAIRAFCYFELVQYFAKPFTDDPGAPGVAIVTTFDPSYLPSRSSVQEVYDFILNDLDNAISKMSSSTNSSQFSQAAAKALKAKVLFQKGDYATAKTLAEDVISTGGFSLVSAANFDSYWADPNYRTDKVETLFEVSFTSLENNGTNSLSYIYNQDGYGDMLCTDDLYALYSNTDVRKGLIIQGTRGGNPALIVNKLPNATKGLLNDDNTKVLRLSEIYLIAAESEARAGTEANALMYLNNLLAQRDPSATPYASSGAQLLTDIITERRKELAFEGNRFQDLNRLKMDIQRNNQYPATAQTITYGDSRRLYPIPQGEIDANPNMQQNPGY